MEVHDGKLDYTASPGGFLGFLRVTEKSERAFYSVTPHLLGPWRAIMNLRRRLSASFWNGLYFLSRCRVNKS
jgi:hypothetical protein